MRFNIADSDLAVLFGFIHVYLGVGVTILTVLVHVVFAVAVYRNATRLNRRQALVIAGVGPTIWCIATLVGGVVTAAIYWAMHHSRLNPDIPIASTETIETDRSANF